MSQTRGTGFWICAILLPVSLVLYVVSLTMDVALIETTIGFGPMQKTTTEAIKLLSTIKTLYERGDWFLVVMITAFTILFPISKYIALAIVMGSRTARSRWLSFVKNFGQWSMGDVFVVALVVVIVRINSSVAQVGVSVQPGLYVFAASVLTSMVVSTILAYRSKETA